MCCSCSDQPTTLRRRAALWLMCASSCCSSNSNSRGCARLRRVLVPMRGGALSAPLDPPSLSSPALRMRFGSAGSSAMSMAQSPLRASASSPLSSSSSSSLSAMSSLLSFSPTTPPERAWRTALRSGSIIYMSNPVPRRSTIIVSPFKIDYSNSSISQFLQNRSR